MTKKIRRIQILLLAVLMVITTIVAGCGCASEAVTADAELTETEATETDAAEETTTDIDEEITNAEKTAEEITSEEETEPEVTTDENTTTEEKTTTEVETTTEESTAASTAGYTYTSMDKTMYVKKQVNVRSLPSTDGAKLGSLSAGTVVTVTGQCNETDWYRISYNGGVGYCSNNYLTETEPTTTAASNTGTSSGSNSESSTDDESVEYVEMTLEEFYSLCISYVVALVNEERATAGLSELEVDVTLVEIAMTRAEELATVFSHYRPDGSSCYTAYDEAGYDYAYAAENIAFGFDNPYDVMEAWMNSEGHRANILSESATCIGVGVYLEDGYLYWVQEFASPYRSNTPESCSHNWWEFDGRAGVTSRVYDSEGNIEVTQKTLYDTVYYICEYCAATCVDLECQHNWVQSNTGSSAYVGTCGGLEYTIAPGLYYYVCTKCGAFWVE